VKTKKLKKHRYDDLSNPSGLIKNQKWIVEKLDNLLYDRSIMTWAHAKEITISNTGLSLEDAVKLIHPYHLKNINWVKPSSIPDDITIRRAFQYAAHVSSCNKGGTIYLDTEPLNDIDK